MVLIKTRQHSTSPPCNTKVSTVSLPANITKIHDSISSQFANKWTNLAKQTNRVKHLPNTELNWLLKVFSGKHMTGHHTSKQHLFLCSDKVKQHQLFITGNTHPNTVRFQPTDQLQTTATACARCQWPNTQFHAVTIHASNCQLQLQVPMQWKVKQHSKFKFFFKSYNPGDNWNKLYKPHAFGKHSMYTIAINTSLFYSNSVIKSTEYKITT